MLANTGAIRDLIAIPLIHKWYFGSWIWPIGCIVLVVCTIFSLTNCFFWLLLVYHWMVSWWKGILHQNWLICLLFPILLLLFFFFTNSVEILMYEVVLSTICLSIDTEQQDSVKSAMSVPLSSRNAVRRRASRYLSRATARTQIRRAVRKTLMTIVTIAEIGKWGREGKKGLTWWTRDIVGSIVYGHRHQRWRRLDDSHG